MKVTITGVSGEARSTLDIMTMRLEGSIVEPDQCQILVTPKISRTVGNNEIINNY